MTNNPKGFGIFLELALLIAVPDPDYTNRAGRGAFAAALVGEEVNTQGVTTSDLSYIEYGRRRVPLFPFERGVRYE